MSYPKKIRYMKRLRVAGNSLYVLIPSVIRQLLKLNNNDPVILTCDTTNKAIIIRKARKTT